MTSPRVKALRERLFGDVLNDWQRYHARIADLLTPGMTVVEVGPGKGTIAPFAWDDHDVTLIGLDPDPAAEHNRFLDRFALLTPGRDWPVTDQTADVVVSRYVLEHVENPDHFMANVARVLRPGGQFVFLTPNRAHPIMTVSRLLPHRAHQAILARTKRQRAGDVFPTFYRANSRAALTALAARSGLDVRELVITEFVPLGYLDFALPGFLLALAYYNAVTRTGLDRAIGLSILGVFARPATG